MRLLVTDLGYVCSYRTGQALRRLLRGCTVSHRQGPGVSTRSYRINTPATGTMRSNEHTLAALVCEQQAKCCLSGSHLSAGIEVLAFESIPSLVTSWQITLRGRTKAPRNTKWHIPGIRERWQVVPLKGVYSVSWHARNLLWLQKKIINFSVINLTRWSFFYSLVWWSLKWCWHVPLYQRRFHTQHIWSWKFT